MRDGLRKARVLSVEECYITPPGFNRCACRRDSYLKMRPWNYQASQVSGSMDAWNTLRRRCQVAFCRAICPDYLVPRICRPEDQCKFSNSPVDPQLQTRFDRSLNLHTVTRPPSAHAINGISYASVMMVRFSPLIASRSERQALLTEWFPIIQRIHVTINRFARGRNKPVPNRSHDRHSSGVLQGCLAVRGRSTSFRA